MSVQIIESRDGAILYCSTSMWAFGPVFDDEEAAVAFCDWFTDGGAIAAAVISGKVGIPALDDRASRDPRAWSQHDLETLYGIWLDQREEAVAS